jgi:hypothetical protein
MCSVRTLGRWLRQSADLDSAGINRHGVANERVVQGRSSDPPWPPAIRGRSKGRSTEGMCASMPNITRSEVRTVCVRSARTGLCGGQRVTAVPAAPVSASSAVCWPRHACPWTPLSTEVLRFMTISACRRTHHLDSHRFRYGLIQILRELWQERLSADRTIADLSCASRRKSVQW